MELTGNEIIDSQHVIIDNAISKLEDILINREKSEFNESKILEDIIDYYDIHFYSESIYLNKSGLSQDRIEDHKKDHIDFLNHLKEMAKNEKVTVDLILYLKKWNKYHRKERYNRF